MRLARRGFSLTPPPMAVKQQVDVSLKVRPRMILFPSGLSWNVPASDEELPGLRLMRTVVAALLALCMAVFPVAMPQAAASKGHGHGSAVHAQDGHAHGSATHDHDIVEHEHAASHDGDEESSSACCGTTTCHAFQISSLPTLGARLSLIGVVQVAYDHQVPGVFSGRLDRPPRTV